MTTNGNDSQLDRPQASRPHGMSRSDLAAAIAHKSVTEPAEPAERQVNDLARQIGNTAQMLRQWADYANSTATDLERITEAFIASTGRMMGKLGK